MAVEHLSASVSPSVKWEQQSLVCTTYMDEVNVKPAGAGGVTRDIGFHPFFLAPSKSKGGCGTEGKVLQVGQSGLAAASLP